MAMPTHTKHGDSVGDSSGTPAMAIAARATGGGDSGGGGGDGGGGGGAQTYAPHIVLCTNTEVARDCLK
eukprot:COSAG01_NODE_1737_length_9362_cov_165.799309_3_plen_69_part_00